MLRQLCLLSVLLLFVVTHGNQTVPDLQRDQPVRVQPGPSLLDNEDYESRVKDFAARALEILAIRARVKKRKSKYRSRARSFKSPTCEAGYEALSATHTMCLKDVGRAVTLSKAAKDAILRQHNVYRAKVSPTASNMQTMVWDDTLAEVAAKWSSQCRRGHDTASDRATPDLPGVHIGQNAAYGYRNWQTAIEAWHDEVSDFDHGHGSLDGAVVGHYTQLVAWRSSRVGCGHSDCPDSPYKRHFVCNYAVGQMNDDPKAPYRAGKPCADCPDKCNEAGTMCDCGGLLCLNGGKLNLNTCQCSCPNIYTGEVCQTLQCPVQDPWYCGSQWPPDFCKQYVNVPHDCPYMCNVCSADSPVTPDPRPCRLRCKNGGKLDITKCTCICPEGFAGRRCEKKARVCDGKTCLNGGQLNTVSCICDCPFGVTGDRCETKVQVCDGKVCQNGGRLNTSSCHCQCPEGYEGSECQTKSVECEGLVCENGGRLDTGQCQCQCPPDFTGKRCHKEKCADVTCHHGGQLNYTDCSCTCVDGYEGPRCKNKEEVLFSNTVCDKTCQNGGLLDPVHCICWCPSPFTGEICDEVECPEEDREPCENLPETYCQDHFLMLHLCPYKCGLCKKKECDPDKWFCNENYIKPHLCRVVGPYCPAYCGLC